MKTILKSLWLGLCVLALLGLPVSAQKLTGVSPANFSTGVGKDTTVTFTFDTDMKPIQDFSWLANSGGFPSQITGFSYVWTTTRKLVATKSGGFPANTMIIWTANEEGFADQLGFPLDSNGMNSGFFTTGSGSGGGGGGGAGGGAAEISLSKLANYAQTTAADPVLDTDLGYEFSVFVTAPESRGLTNVSLTIPGGAVSNLFSSPFQQTNFFLLSYSNDLAAVEAKFPPGNYGVGLQAPGSNQTVAVAFPATPIPSAVKFSNFAAGQTVDPAADFTLQFNAGGVASDYVFVGVNETGSASTIYKSPDPAEAGYLIGTSTHIVLPAGSLVAGKTYEVYLERWIPSTNNIGGNAVVVGVGSFTQTSLKTLGGVVAMIELRNPTFSGGFFSAEATVTANQTYHFERSTDAAAWIEVSSAFALATTQTFTDLTATNPHAIYRVRKD
jgi:hypothetical protein